MSEPSDKIRMTQFKALHRMIGPVSGVPLREDMKKYLVYRTWLKRKKENKDVDYDSLPKLGTTEQEIEAKPDQ